MARSRQRGRRVDAATRSLHCGTCGAGNRLSAEAREQGWFRCRYCESAEPVPGVGDFAIQGPCGRATRVVRPGSSEIVTRDNLVFPAPIVALIVVGADLLAAALLHVTGEVDPALAATCRPVLAGVIAVGGVAGILGVLTRQHLVVTADRIDLWWVTLGRRWRHRALATQRFATSAFHRGRSGVEIRTPVGRMLVHMAGAESLRWLEREIIAAVKEARPGDAEHAGDRVPCPGCGGPVADAKALRDEGSAECPHCLTGLVRTEGGMALPPVRIRDRLDTPKAAPPAATRREGQTQTWRSAAWWRSHPIATPFNVLIALAIDVAVIGGSGYGVWHVPMLQVTAAGVALALTGACIASSRGFYVWTFGRHLYRLGPRVLEHEVWIGPWRCLDDRIPLARIVSLEARPRTITAMGETHDAPGAVLEVELAARSLRIEAYGAHAVPAARGVVAALPDALRALGRSVEGDAVARVSR